MRFTIRLLSLCLALLALPLYASSTADLSLEVTAVNGTGTRIAWGELGDPGGPPVVLVMGLGASHKLWGEEIPDALAQAGMRVILLDNRDVGQSQRFDEAGNPVLWWNMLKVQFGFEPWTAYSLDDMADDVVGLMDHLQIEQAHVVGVSMGGMIAQLVAVNHPQRTRSLISIMSSTGAPHLPPPTDEASARLQGLAGGDGDNLQEARDAGFYPEAMPRQLMAIFASGDRSERLAQLQTPTLVIHGIQDPLVPVEHGRHTAQVIPGAALREVDGMEHNIPDAVRPQVIEAMLGHLQRY